MIDSLRAAFVAIDWPWLARLVPRAAVAGVIGGWALAVLTTAPAADSIGAPVTASWGGDYPAFQTAGRIVRGGDASRLYDPAIQQAYQAGMPTDGFLPFLYPPFVAALYAPLAGLPYRTSYAVFTLLSLAALLAAVRAMAPISATVRSDPWRALAAALLFYPLLRSTLGGQNTAISLLLLCGAWRLFHDQRDLAAGVVLGLLSYKPQFLLPISGAIVLAGRQRAAAGIVLCGAGLYAAGAALTGWDWPAAWWSAARAFADLDRHVNAANSISLGQLTELAGWPAGWMVMSAALSAWVGWVAYAKGRADFFAVFAIAIAASLLIPPHAMFYDVGIALPSLLWLADRGHAREAALLWLAGASQMLAVAWPLSPLGVVVLVLLVLLHREVA